MAKVYFRHRILTPSQMFECVIQNLPSCKGHTKTYYTKEHKHIQTIEMR